MLSARSHVSYRSRFVWVYKAIELELAGQKACSVNDDMFVSLPHKLVTSRSRYKFDSYTHQIGNVYLAPHSVGIGY